MQNIRSWGDSVQHSASAVASLSKQCAELSDAIAALRESKLDVADAVTTDMVSASVVQVISHALVVLLESGERDAFPAEAGKSSMCEIDATRSMQSLSRLNSVVLRAAT